MDLLRKFSNICRQAVFEDKTSVLYKQVPKILQPLYSWANSEQKLQLSFMGRALPLGYRESDALTKHMKAYSEEPHVDEQILSDLRGFVESSLLKGEKLHPSFLPKISSLSSSIESNRSENGQAGYIEYLINQYRYPFILRIR